MRPGRCPVCGARGAVAVAAPRATAMLSDGTPLGLPVQRLSCPGCGSASLHPATLNRLPRRLFGPRYTLNIGPPGAADLARQEGYARWIAGLWPGAAPPRSVLDIGCGNGALLLALGRRWPQARLRGVEPAPGAAAAARQAGLPVRPALGPGLRAALVVSVNVIEHVANPLGFLRALRRAVAPGGAAVVICPDGTAPWIELLFADHRASFTPDGLARLAGCAGMRLVAANRAPQGDFQALVLRPTLPRRPFTRRRAPAHAGLAAARRAYLGRWRALAAMVLARRTPNRRLIAFGAGEAAQLLRAYAPALWSDVAAVTADDPAGAAMLGKPVIGMAEVRIGQDELLLAVRPQSQPQLAERLTAAGHRVLRWDGVVAR